MSSRANILQSIRSHALTSEPLPEHTQEGVQYPDPIAKFCEVLALVGGRGVHVATRAEAQASLNEIPVYSPPSNVCRLVPVWAIRTSGPIW